MVEKRQDENRRLVITHYHGMIRVTDLICECTTAILINECMCVPFSISPHIPPTTLTAINRYNQPTFQTMITVAFAVMGLFMMPLLPISLETAVECT